MKNSYGYAHFVAAALALHASVAAGDPLRERAAALFGTVEPLNAEESAAPAAQLGRALFWDRRLSADGQTACASCHLAEDWGADRRQRSTDARGRLTQRHAQSVLNAQAATAGLRWLADRATGADQALGSITGSMGFASRAALIPLLHEHGYAPLFEAAYPGDEGPVGADRYAQALQSYQESLRTPAPFDAWLTGDDGALDERQLRGLERFIETGCGGCHGGPLFGGANLQRFGNLEDYRPLTGSDGDDAGLMEQTGKESDRDVFRVQPLRNVAGTAPYFHDGSVAELGDAVRVMAKVQLGQTLSAPTVTEIVQFLEALSGPLPPHYGPPASH
jgi:cytochrome c peroxidase